MNSLKDKVENDPYLYYYNGSLKHRICHDKVTKWEFSGHLIFEEVIYVVQQLENLGIKLYRIELPALVRVIHKHIFNGEISLCKSRNIGVFLKQLLTHPMLFDYDMMGAGLIKLLRAEKEGGDHD